MFAICAHCFAAKVYFNYELLRFCHVEIKYYSIEFEQAYSDLLSWIWVYFPICLGLVYMAFRLMSYQEMEELSLHGEPKSWQLMVFQRLPARALSRIWGNITAKELPKWCRRPVLGLYVWLFGCKMEEALVEDIREYPSLLKLFTRQLKDGARTICAESSLVSPCDGKVLHFGVVKPDGYIEQVKGVTYRLDKFLGSRSSSDTAVTGPQHNITSSGSTQLEKCLYHILIYLAPGDYHHFHSPTDWTINTRRHFPGELLTVAPWAVKKLPGVFALNERTALLGRWTHGFFSYTAVGAFNVGSIQLSFDKDLKTNIKGRYRIGDFNEKTYGNPFNGITVNKGDRLGWFNLGSTIVLVFEAPKYFQFQVNSGDQVYFGQPL